MKTRRFFRLLLALLFLSVFSTTKAQQPLSSLQIATAHKKAVAEATMYHNKGFHVFRSSHDMQTLLENFYKDVYRETQPGQRVYLWAMGTAKASTTAEAEIQALDQAKQHFPGLLLMYFNSWVSSNKHLTVNDKKLLINAINKSEKSITQKIAVRKPDKEVIFMKSKKGRYQASVRVLYKQMPLREMARNEIKKQLRKTTGWSENKMNQFLHFKN